jgi:hypothetical protein
MVKRAIEPMGKRIRAGLDSATGERNGFPLPLGEGQVTDPALRQALLESERPSFDAESSFDPEVSGPKGRTKCGVEDRVVTVRLRSLSLTKVEGSEVEPPQAGVRADHASPSPCIPPRRPYGPPSGLQGVWGRPSGWT